MDTTAITATSHVRRLRRRASRTVLPMVASISIAAAVVAANAGSALAAEGDPVGLGTAASYSVLGGSTVTNTGPTTLSGDLGVSPGTAITGSAEITVHGATHATDEAAAQAQIDLTTAYGVAASLAPTGGTVSGDLGVTTLTAGVYKSTSTLGLSGTLTLDAEGDPDAVFIFQVASALTTGSGSRVILTNDAQACHVYWQVGSSATLGTNSRFVGSILALTSIAVTTGATVEGRALASTDAVTLDSNTFTVPSCKSSSVVPSDDATETTTAATGTTAEAAGSSATKSSATHKTRKTQTRTRSKTTAVVAVPSVWSGPGLDRGQNTVGPPPLAATGPRDMLPFLLAGGLLLGVGGLLVATARKRSYPKH